MKPTGLDVRNDTEIAEGSPRLAWHVWVPTDVQATVEKAR